MPVRALQRKTCVRALQSVASGIVLERSNAARSLRLAGAPISWGVCEVPGWGVQLSPDRVLSEMAALGLTATELGALGWLPLDGKEVKHTLDRYGLQLVGGFVPVLIHHDG